MARTCSHLEIKKQKWAISQCQTAVTQYPLERPHRLRLHNYQPKIESPAGNQILKCVRRTFYISYFYNCHELSDMIWPQTGIEFKKIHIQQK